MIHEKIKYVNAYAVSRNWGGPEEGGWWYDSGEPLASIPMAGYADEKFIEHIKEKLTSLIGWPKENRQGRFSVNGGEDFEIQVEEQFAKAYPEVRPHYE